MQTRKTDDKNIPCYRAQHNHTAKYAKNRIIYLLFMLTGIYFLQRMQIFPRFYAYYSSEQTFHDQSIDFFSVESDCRSDVYRSYDKRQVCNLKGTTYFLKKLDVLARAKDEKSAKPGKPGLISHEEFNRQFVEKNIGALVPRSAFFAQPMMLKQPKFYIGSEIIEGLRHTVSDEEALKKLGNENFARLTVASMFIEDLHAGNWGYTDNGLYLVDVDADDNIPKDINDYIFVAHKSLLVEGKKLSIDNIVDIKNILEHMKLKPLPKFHESFNLTNEVYLQLLNIFTRSCEEVIGKLRTLYPTLKSDALDRKVNFHLSEKIFNYYLPTLRCAR